MDLYLGSDRVFDSDHDDAGEVVQDVVLVVPVGLSGFGGEVPVSHADGSQSVARHRLDHLMHHLVTVLGLEHARLALGVQDTRASRSEERDAAGRLSDVNKKQMNIYLFI